MKLQTLRPYKSLKPGEVDGVDLARFTVLTGQNGAGKSNLLEAIQSGAVIFAELGQLPPDRIRMFSIGQLLATAEGPVSPAAYKEPWANLHNNMQTWRQHANLAPELAGNPQQQDAWIANQVIGARMMTQAAMIRMQEESGKRLIDFTLDDFRYHSPLINGIKDPFAASIAEVFLSYAQRRYSNDVAQYRQQKGRGTALTDEEFDNRFGGPPWELLDETLTLVGLPYHFVPPPEDSEMTNYEVMLVNESNESIRPGDLSSGERVLLAVAMSLFTGSRMSEAIELPAVLLLDEADASLHPSMVKSLLTVIEEIFVKQYGVAVIMTTHSPSTVALAPAESLFIMSRGPHRLRAATSDEAVAILAVGLSALSVSTENRRQVFVESQHDQEVYQNLFRIIKGQLSTERSLEFIAASNGDVEGGCDAVKRFVKELRGAGLASVHGVIDRDKRGGAPEHVHFIPDRYSVENLVLDPMILGVFLIREKLVSNASLNLSAAVRHFEIGEEHGSAIIGSLSNTLNLFGEMMTVDYLGGFSVEVPKPFLDMKGHGLQDLIVERFPPLNRFRNLKKEIVDRAIADRPAVVPKVAIDLFKTLSS